MTPFDQALAAMVADYGEPVETVTHTRSPSDGPEPRRIDVLVYRHPARRSWPERTTFLTVGLSAVDLPGPERHVEFLLYFDAVATPEQVAQTAQELAELCYRVADEKIPVESFIVWDDVTFGIFPGRPHTVVTHGTFTEPLVVPDTDGPTLLMDLKCLYPSEAAVFAAATDRVETHREQSRAVDALGKRWQHPDRVPIV